MTLEEHKGDLVVQDGMRFVLDKLEAGEKLDSLERSIWRSMNEGRLGMGADVQKRYDAIVSKEG